MRKGEADEVAAAAGTPIQPRGPNKRNVGPCGKNSHAAHDPVPATPPTLPSAPVTWPEF